MRHRHRLTGPHQRRPLTQQAVQAGHSPQRHHHPHLQGERGPDLHPRGQLALLVACIALVLAYAFHNLAAAYGIAVTGTMGITTVVYSVVITERWKWPLWKAILSFSSSAFFDLGYSAANAAKLHDGAGGWALSSWALRSSS
ncbi:MAG: KUP/HAK/KT family potassium transporter [Polyangiaceae bacterium]